MSSNADRRGVMVKSKSAGALDRGPQRLSVGFLP